MSQPSRGIFGAIAISLTCGVVQLASGRDLAGSPATPEAAINRAAKADRAAGVAGSAVPTRTISLRLDGLADTSILVRVPVAKEVGNKEIGKEARNNNSSAPSLTKSGERKVKVACEPVVSVLTEVAKLLQPGRCIT